MWQMLQKPSVNWSFTHAFVPVCTNRLPGTLLLVAGSDFFVSQTRFLQSAKTTQNTVDDSWKDGCYWHNQNADALPNTSVKQNPSWLGFENIILKQSSTWETHLFGTDVYSSSPLECKQSSPSKTLSRACPERWNTQLLYHVSTVQNITEIQVFTRRLRRALFHTNLYLQPFGRPVARKKKKKLLTNCSWGCLLKKAAGCPACARKQLWATAVACDIAVAWGD